MLGRRFCALQSLNGNVGADTRRQLRSEEGAAESPRPIASLSYYLQPEQSEQQAAEGQHPVRAAFAVPASPSATTATNTITLNFLMAFSFRSGKSCSEAEK
jgi:hypothetical protein